MEIDKKTYMIGTLTTGELVGPITSVFTYGVTIRPNTRVKVITLTLDSLTLIHLQVHMYMRFLVKKCSLSQINVYLFTLYSVDHRATK